MELITLLIASVIILALCLLAMAVGVIFRNKTFTSCGCASITYRGEKIRCPSCPDTDEEGEGEGADKPCA